MTKTPFRKRCLLLFIFSLVLISVFLVVKNKFDLSKFFKIQKIKVEKIVKYFPFSTENSLNEWEEKVLKGKVVYRIERGATFSHVKAESSKAASALYYRVKMDVGRNPVISWKWRVWKFPEKSLPEKIEDTKEEDFAARVYVIFPAAFFTNSKVVEYIWSETLPAGTWGISGYSKNIRVLVLETGKSDEWIFEKRDIVEDYVKLFGEKPRLNVGAISFMTDADSTKTSALAVYDEITIGYE